jgi:hypothetical protein
VLLDLTARLPAVGGTWGARRGTLEARVGSAGGVGSVEIGRTELTSGWQRWEARIDRERLRPGLNRLTLAWPSPPPIGEAARRDAVERLEIGVAADLHPVFGEIFSLIARPASSG